VRVVNLTLGGEAEGRQGARWLRAAAVALGVLAAAAAAVSWQAQYAMVWAVKQHRWVAALEAGIPDVGADCRAGTRGHGRVRRGVRRNGGPTKRDRMIELAGQRRDLAVVPLAEVSKLAGAVAAEIGYSPGTALRELVRHVRERQGAPLTAPQTAKEASRDDQADNQRVRRAQQV
jgi:hypothetical protein